MSFRLIVTLAAVLIAFSSVTSLLAADSDASIPAGFRQRAGRTKESLAAAGANEESERAVAAALNWLARHQNPDGSWGCHKCLGHCKDPSCALHSEANAPDYPVAATAFGLLPFLAAGQSHESKGAYQHVIQNGVIAMSKMQDAESGRLSNAMYEHALGTMALCEAYGLSQDKQLGESAQGAVRFLEDAQNFESGGWHYSPSPPTVGDLSVTGWQIMALRTAQMAGLKVKPQTFHRASQFLASVSKGKALGLACYSPDAGPTPTMTAIALLCNQCAGRKPNDPAQEEGMAYLVANLNQARNNTYFQYYATQAMHNRQGLEWQRWNERNRVQLIWEQSRDECADGSWSPHGKGHVAGRLMATSFSALTLQIYYRYQPLQQVEVKPQP